MDLSKLFIQHVATTRLKRLASEFSKKRNDLTKQREEIDATIDEYDAILSEIDVAIEERNGGSRPKADDEPKTETARPKETDFEDKADDEEEDEEDVSKDADIDGVPESWPTFVDAEEAQE